jgi:hypothetical protein
MVISMTDSNGKRKKILEEGKNLACVSGAQMVSFDKELEKIEEEERRVWKKLSFLL